LTRIFVLMILASAVIAPADAPPAADFSTPRAAAKSFYNAIEAGDVATIRMSMLAEDDAQRKLVDAFTDVIAASGKLATAARDRFGAAGDALGMSAIPKEQAARIDKGDEKIDGNDATLTLSDRPVPMTFRKSGGGWKRVVTDFAGATPANISSQIDLLNQLAQNLNDTASEIAAGKYQSPEQAQTAFQDRMNAAMIKAVTPATKPTATTKP